MALSELPTKYRYQGNGVTDTFAYSSKAFGTSFLVVQLITRATDAVVETLTITTDYTVTILTNETASITVSAGKIPSATQDILIYLDLPLTQTVELPSGTSFDTVQVESALDKNVALLQAAYDILGRSLTVPEAEIVGTTNLEIPSVGDRANKYLAFDASGNLTSTSGTTTVPVSTAMEDFCGSASLALARTELDVYSTTDIDFALEALRNREDAFTGNSGSVSYRNKLINGNFSVNQRGVSGTVTLGAGVYGHDGLKGGAAGATYTFATSGIDTVITISAGSVIATALAEDIVGGNYVLSWTGTAQGKINAGTAGASGVTASSLPAATNITCEWGTGTLSKIQLEEGTFPTYFERISPKENLERCQYRLPAFNSENTTSCVGPAYVKTTTVAQLFYPFKVTPRVVPTGITVNDPTHFTVNLKASNVACTDVTIASLISKEGCTVNCTVASGLTAGEGCLIYSTNAAGQILFTGGEP